MFRILRRPKNKIWRYAITTFVILFILVTLVILFISPIAKYLIEKNSEKYIGRKVKMSWLYLNPFSGYIYAHNVTVFENESEEAFVKVAGLSTNISVGKLFSKTFDLSFLKFDKLWVNVIQDSTVFNFSDLIETDSLKKAVSDTLHFCIRNIKITDSEFHYHERTIPITYYIKNVSIQCPAVEWNVDTTHVDYYFVSGIGSGSVKGSVNLNMRSSSYDLKAVVAHFDLKVLEQYMKDFSRYGTFSAFLDADIHAKGNVHDNLDVLTTGKLAISDFHLGKTAVDDYFSFAKFSMNIDSMNPAKKKFFFSSLLLDSSFVKYEKYDQYDNFTRMLGDVQQVYVEHKELNIIFLIADYLKEVAKNLVNSQYRVDQLSITNSRLLYNDFSLLEKFSTTAFPLKITAQDINTHNKRMFITLESKLNPFGNADVKVDINPNDFGDFHLVYKISDLPLPLLNPYTITYSSFPFNKGDITFTGTWNVVNKQIKSQNDFTIVNASRADKVKNKGAKHMALPLILGVIRHPSRNIHIEIPITGDLKSPKYHLGDVIVDVIENIFVKPPSLPYFTTVHKQEIEKEDFVLMEWKPMQTAMDDDQSDQLKKISHYLDKNPQSHLIISPKYFETKEKEMILLFEGKKKYYLATHHLKSISEDDSVAISKISIKDSGFVHYLDRNANPTGIEWTVQGKCLNLIGHQKVDERYNEMIESRKKNVIDFFKEKNLTDQVTFEHGVSTIPPSGFSHYVFRYKEGTPPSE